MADLSKLSETKLRALIEKLAAKSSACGSALIQAGFGNERGSETRARAAATGDALAVAWCEANDAVMAAYGEERERLRYQGNRKPIKRSAFA